MGWQHTAPVAAIELFERFLWIEEHPGWTFSDYDNARAGDILLHREFRKIVDAIRKRTAKDARAD